MARDLRRPIKIETASLPEFGLDVNWAMCRNPMCANFGVHFEGEIPADRKQTSDERYTVRTVRGALKEDTGEIQCRDCGQSSRLHSNRAIRAIARHFLSLSLPYADCPDPECASHGVNLFEHWTKRGSGEKRFYRRDWAYGAKCSHCGTLIRLGTPLGVKNDREAKFDSSPKEETREEKKKRLAAERQNRREVRGAWKTILEGVRTQRTVTNTIEVSGMGTGNYYRYLARIDRRLRDYHAFRNAGLLQPDIARRIERRMKTRVDALKDEIKGLKARGVKKRKRKKIEAQKSGEVSELEARIGKIGRKEPIFVYTDVLEVSIKAFRPDRRYQLMSVVASAILADNTVFALAAHPCFLPEHLCPSREAARPDRERLDFEAEWSCLWHPHRDYPALSTEKRQEKIPQYGLNGYFIRSPYAELAHFLVVQKMLSRFENVYFYTDAAKDLFSAGLIALRGRILAGGRQDPPARRRGRPRKRPGKAEIVLFQHDKKKYTKTNAQILQQPDWDKSEWGEDALGKAWEASEKQFDELEVPDDLLKESVAKGDPRVRALLFKLAFRGANFKGGQWAWLPYPPPSPAYRECRSLWLTRMPDKTFEEHGKPALLKSTLQPVDSLFNSIRARTSALGRPVLRAAGRGYRASYVLPRVVLQELTVYLLSRNYMLRRKTTQKTIPAQAMGLVTEGAADLDMLEAAWDFRLGIAHAEKMSRWQKT